MFKQNIRGALRSLQHQPMFAAAVIGMLALGIGATTAIFSVVYGVLLQPLPFPNADRIVEVWGSRSDRGWNQVTLTEANFWDMRDMNHVFEEFGALHAASVILAGTEGPEQVNAAIVSSGFFRALGVRPIAGALFTPEDDKPGAATRPVLLSEGLWKRRYGGDKMPF